MSLEAIKQVTETEENIQTHKAAAEAEARQIVADAEKAGQAHPFYDKLSGLLQTGVRLLPLADAEGRE